jgi:hypothetical protein
VKDGSCRNMPHVKKPAVIQFFLQYPCPTCKADVGQWCFNRITDEPFIGWMHSKRVKLANESRNKTVVMSGTNGNK